ncbi:MULTISPECIES: VanZ family protein [unclassified Microbacterium]|uniref:VanZ family protein n=1 Tax=unclassified Microbacterium TaxID=2609290 RepID=UPI002469BFBC|nr:MULTISPECIES: VanZ family protein [unclassified Microbacterium]MDH5134399.1 VanZ family protein [Microbacterium sp. RD10]MDH5136764.1 VanZ family protein [Microbacterium sp. RD11]MDH5145674.1 VanZ family protein [Microbacterium sp. RD12]MDH5155189.1 VanZ family protein [Microbacterium sp. RD06]MDH5166705.1 VanZ family protein [Microbacterium sp. RD02]
MTPTLATRAPRGRVAARVALVGYLLFVGFTVWLPAAVSSTVTGLVGVMARWVAEAGIAPYQPSAVVLEILANVALFVPVGLLLPFAWPRLRLWQVTLAGGLLSVVIETVQGLMPSRFPTLSDVIANTTGTFLGAVVATLLLALLSRGPDGPRDPRLAS